MEPIKSSINVFGDDSFVVDFKPGNPIGFELTTFGENSRNGTFEPFSEGVTFEDWRETDSTDSRIVVRGYHKWASGSSPDK